MTGPGGRIIIATTWTPPATRRWWPHDQQLEARVEQLEAQQAPRDPNYTPPGVDRDLMYSDHYVEQTYSNRPTTVGVVAFWVLAIPTALAVSGFFIWLIWFKRWQTATSTCRLINSCNPCNSFNPINHHANAPA